MVVLFFRIAVGAVVVSVIALGAVPAYAATRELATAQGAIAISEARQGLRPPSCSELIVEARDALDDHLIAETSPTMDQAGVCRYVLTVPAQTAVWLRAQPVLVASARAFKNTNTKIDGAEHARLSGGSVALRFTIITATTNFFAPGEQRTIPLSY